MKAINLIINILKARSQAKLIEKVSKLCEDKTQDLHDLYNYAVSHEKEEVRLTALKNIDNLTSLLKIADNKNYSLEIFPKGYNLLQRKIHKQKYDHCLTINCNENSLREYATLFNNKELADIVVNMKNRQLALMTFKLIKDDKLRFKIFRKSSDKKLLQNIIKNCQNNKVDNKFLETLEKSAPNNRLQNLATQQLELFNKKENKKANNEIIIERNNSKKERQQAINLYQNIINEINNIHKNVNKNTDEEQIHNLTASLQSLEKKWQTLPTIPDEYYEILELSFTKDKINCQQKLVQLDSLIKENTLQSEKLKILLTKVNSEIKDFQITNSEDFQLMRNSAEKYAKKLLQFTEDKLITDYNHDNRILINDISSLIGDAKNRLKIISDSITPQLTQMLSESNDMIQKIDDNHSIKEQSNALLDKLNTEIILTNNSIHNSLINNLRRSLKNIKNHLINEYHSNDLARWEHYTEKLKLCEAVEKLNEITDLHLVAKKLKKYRETWKKIGTVPKDKSDEIWERFQQNSNILYQKCTNFYESLREQQTIAIEKKKALIEQAKNFVNADNFSEATENFANLFTEWKKIGYVGDNKEEEKLFQDLKSLNDQFYKRKQQFFTQRSEEFHNNAESKKTLIVQVEELLNNIDNIEKSELISSAKKLRSEWKNIGKAKHSEEQQLWNKFNGVINQIFESLNGDKNDNFIAKNEIVQKISELKEQLLVQKKNIDFEFDFSLFKNLRANFFTIGHCEEKNEKKLQQKFTRNCEDIFKEQDLIFEKNSTKRENIIEQLEELYLELQKQEDNLQIAKSVIKSTKDLQKKWKTLKLPNSNKDSQAQWEQFQVLCNNIFAMNNNLFSQEQSNRERNYQEKLSLCLQLEVIVSKFSAANDDNDANDNNKLLLTKNYNDLALELTMAITNNSTDDFETLKSAVKEVKNINNKWQQVGAVTNQYTESIYNRYRTARQQFFAILNK